MGVVLTGGFLNMSDGKVDPAFTPQADQHVARVMEIGSIAESGINTLHRGSLGLERRLAFQFGNQALHVFICANPPDRFFGRRLLRLFLCVACACG